MTAGERRLRDGVDDDDNEYSGVLLERISNDHVSELKDKQLSDEQNFTDSDSDDTDGQDSDKTEQCHKNGIINDELYPQTPASFRQHWGEFDVKDNATIKPADNGTTTKRSLPKKIQKQNYITVVEKDLLKEEFIGIMHSKFLSGEDVEFNYADVDDNAEYDHIEQQSQDQEDKYFDADDDSCAGITDEPANNEPESEDELDTYMKQISS